jgi:HEAT repeat protein
MKLKTSTSIATWIRLVLAIGLSAFLGALVQPNSADGQQSPNPAATLSPRTRNFVNERWNNASFTQGIAIVADTNETPSSRAAAMQELNANRKKLTPVERRRFLGEATRLAKDTSLDETNSAFAVSVMANLTLTMRDQGQLSDAESKQEAGFLMATATDLRRNAPSRGSAIVALGILKVAEARGVLRELLTNSPVEIARPACLSLMRVDGDRAIPDLANTLKKTSDARLFGTAAFALGQLKKRECVGVLVENLGRFPDSGACDAALVDMDDVICGILKDPQDESLSAAVPATRYLWREGQREIYTPLLRNLLSKAPMAARKAAAERLLESASCLNFESEKRELALALIAIGDQPELLEYQERIRSRLSAAVVTPVSDGAVQIPTVLKGGESK